MRVDISGLDPSQRAFCEAPDADIRLLAPAGCGKTLCLLMRCAVLADRACLARPRFLLVAFTVAARHEMASRLSSDPRLQAIRDTVEICTLNAWGYRRVREAGRRVWLLCDGPDYVRAVGGVLKPIVDAHAGVAAVVRRTGLAASARGIVRAIDGLKSLGFDHERHASEAPFLRRWLELDGEGMDAQRSHVTRQLADLGLLGQSDPEVGCAPSAVSGALVFSRFGSFWSDASKCMFDNGVLTLEDQKYMAWLDERHRYERGEQVAGAARYQHIMVDEFQDINALDLSLLRTIAERNIATLTLVGDDDQSIFQWRGSTPAYLLEPERFLGRSFKTFVLTTDYRHPPDLLGPAQRLIAHNTRRLEKPVQAYRMKGGEVQVVRIHTLAEAIGVLRAEIERSTSPSGPSSTIAVVARKRGHLIPFQICLASLGMAFGAAEDLQVFLSDAFDRLIGVLRSLGDQDTRLACDVVVQRVIALCDLVKRYPLSRSDRAGLAERLEAGRPSSVRRCVHDLAAYRGALKGDNADGRMSGVLSEAIGMFLAAPTVSQALTELGTRFAGFRADMRKAEDDVFFTDPPFEQLADLADAYGGDSERFASDLEAARRELARCDATGSGNGEEQHFVERLSRPVQLMTAPRAKGKEFDTVVLVDANEGVWPICHASTPQELEAERRLFYVAFTRARHRVVLLVRDGADADRAAPSRYLADLGVLPDRHYRDVNDQVGHREGVETCGLVDLSRRCPPVPLGAGQPSRLPLDDAPLNHAWRAPARRTATA